MSTHPEFVVVVTHYGLTRDEFARRRGKHPSCFAFRLRPLCSNGSYHAKCVQDAKQVDCLVCLIQMEKEHIK